MTPRMNYQRLLAKIDEKFGEIAKRQSAHMRCGSGCSTCCMHGLTITAIEATNIRERLREDEAMRKRVLANAGRGGPMGCEFLDEQGACTIYDVRPVVCRSHGVPLVVKLDSSATTAWRQYCPLNFEGVDVESLPELDTINLDTLNTILSLINRQLVGDGINERLSLTLKAMLP